MRQQSILHLLTHTADTHQRTVRQVLCASLTSLLMSGAFALEYQSEIFASAETEDNSLLSSEGTSETTQAYGIQLSLSNQWNAFLLDGDYKATREEFRNNSITDQTIYEGDSTITYDIVDKYANVFISHSAERQLEAVSDIDTPDNEETVNIYRAGTNLGLPIGPKLDFGLNLQTQKIDVAASENSTSSTDKDAEADSAKASLFYQLNPATQFELSSQLVISEREGSNIEQDTLFSYVGFSRNIRRLNYNAQIGESRFDLGPVSESGLFYDFSVGYADEVQALSASISQQDTNTAIGEIDTQISGNSLIDDFVDIDQDSLVNSDSNSAVEISSASLNYSNNVCIRCELTLAASFELTDFKFTLDDANNVVAPDETDIGQTDREETIGRVGFSYRLSNRLSSNITWSREYTSFIGQSGDFEENNYYLSLGWQPRDRLRITSTVFLLNRAPESSGSPNLKNSGATINISYLLLNSQPN